MANPPPIRFEFRFTRSARADAAAEPRQRLARSGQPRQHVLQLRELDLQLAFVRARAPGKDVEDQLGAIDDAPAARLLEVARLPRRQLVVDDDEVRAGLVAGARDLLDLARADERGGSAPARSCTTRSTTLGARGLGEARQFVEL